MTDNKLSFPLLVLDATDGSGSLLDVLKANHPEEDTELVSDSSSAEAKLKSGSHEAILINDTSSSIEELVGTVASFAQHFPGIALLVALQAENKKQVMALLSAGAHGVILLPVTGEELRRTFRIAFRKVDDSKTAAEPSREQIANFPWILENVASRLDSLAQHLREKEGEGDTVVAAPNNVKEALLSALGSTESDKQFCDEFMEWLSTKETKK